MVIGHLNIRSVCSLFVGLTICRMCTEYDDNR